MYYMYIIFINTLVSIYWLWNGYFKVHRYGLTYRIFCLNAHHMYYMYIIFINTLVSIYWLWNGYFWRLLYQYGDQRRFFFFELMKARLHVRVSYPCRHFITPPLVTQSVLYFTKKRSLVKWRKTLPAPIRPLFRHLFYYHNFFNNYNFISFLINTKS